MSIKNFFEKYLNHDDKKVQLFSRIVIFLSLFFVSLFIIYFLFSFLNFQKPYSWILIKSFENSHTVVPYDDLTGFMIQDEMINIQDVCTGWFELAVFISLIIATIDVSLKKRLYGILILIPTFLVFNFTRIYVIVLSLIYLDVGFVDILHTILFKVGLFIFFGLFYYLWLKISTKIK